jgi:hypothetical protein
MYVKTYILCQHQTEEFSSIGAHNYCDARSLLLWVEKKNNKNYRKNNDNGNHMDLV